MKIIIIILVILVGILISFLALYKKDIKTLSKDLNLINDKSLNISKINSNTNSKDLNNLILEINRTLKEKQTLDIEHKNKEKEIKEMIASISHDLRTPLTSIKGYADILSEKLDGEKEIEYIDIIRSRSKSLEELINSFYELSRFELKEYDYNLEYIDLKEVLLEVLASFYDRLTQKEIVPIVLIGEGDFKVIGDIKVMERIFINLIDNGIKYSSSFLKIELARKDGNIILDFINDTRDLRKEDIGKIFDRFFVLDTSRQSESTGLGLYITRQMIEDMGYKIDASLKSDNIRIRVNYNK